VNALELAAVRESRQRVRSDPNKKLSLSLSVFYLFFASYDTFFHSSIQIHGDFYLKIII